MRSYGGEGKDGTLEDGRREGEEVVTSAFLIENRSLFATCLFLYIYLFTYLVIVKATEWKGKRMVRNYNMKTAWSTPKAARAISIHSNKLMKLRGYR